MESNKEPSLWPLAILGIVVSYLTFRRTQNNQTTETTLPQVNAKVERYFTPREPMVVPHIPPSPTDYSDTNGRKDGTPPWKKRLEIAAAFIAFGLLIVNIFQMRATQKSADTADKTLKEMAFEKRAWIGPSSELVLDSSPSFTAARFEKQTILVNMTVKFSVTLQNLGLSPARRENDTFVLYPSEDSNIPPEDWRRQRPCAMSEQSSKNPIGVRAIFPGEKIALINRRAVAVIKARNILAVWIIGCITYQDAEGDQFHHTHILWTADLPSPPVPEVAFEEPRATWVPFTNFRMVDSAVD